MKVFAALLAVLAAAALALLVLGWRWTRDTRALVTRLNARVAPNTHGVVRHADLDHLPAPVRRYLTAVLPDGQAILAGARLQQEGDFLIDATAGRWGPFRATEHFTTRPPGFVWDASITMTAGIPVRVRDGFVADQGFMVASLLGAIPVARVADTPEIAEGALLRYLAEAVWIPTALLPAEGVVWTALSDTSARAALSAGSVSVELDFFFGPDGLIERVFAAERGRDVGGTSVPTPWQGHFRDYRRMAGMLIPVEGAVEWLVDGRAEPYWRGRILTVEPLLPPGY